jgi:hypothetical protein
MAAATATALGSYRCFNFDSVRLFAEERTAEDPEWHNGTLRFSYTFPFAPFHYGISAAAGLVSESSAAGSERFC